MSKPQVSSIQSVNGKYECQHLRLFMYTKTDDLRRIMQSKKLRVSCPWRTNDIVEGVVQGEKNQRELTKSYGYLCFSSVCDNPAMWGYYAERSRGTCLVFDFPVTRETKESYRLLENGWYSEENELIRQVKYKNERSKPQSKIEDILHCKASEWKHEQEYRMLLPLGSCIHEIEKEKNGNVYFYKEGILEHLSGIILGPHCPHQQAEIQAWLKESNFSDKIVICKAEISEKGFKYDINVPDIDRELYFRYMLEYDKIITDAELWETPSEHNIINEQNSAPLSTACHIVRVKEIKAIGKLFACSESFSDSEAVFLMREKNGIFYRCDNLSEKSKNIVRNLAKGTICSYGSPT